MTMANRQTRRTTPITSITPHPPRGPRRPVPRRAGRFLVLPRTRKGVAAVLAMMFLIVFGSLSAAMAIASKGNITTAATHLHVSRAQSAAETGLAIARQRLTNAAGRFLFSESDVNPDFVWKFWTGDTSTLGPGPVLPSKLGRQDLATPAGLAAALAEDHAQDANTEPTMGIATPVIGNMPAGLDDTEYMTTAWVFTPAIALEDSGGDAPGLAYSITYAPLVSGTDIRVIVTGYDFGYSRGGMPVTRTVMEDFRVAKRVKHAIISPSRIMIGKNVMVTGDLGARYTGVTHNDGDPILLRSDFSGLSAVLDAKLAAFHAKLGTNDVDGDNRLRVRHPVESLGIPSGATDYNGDGKADEAFADATGDGYVDEFDIFISHFDANGDRRVTLSATLTAGTPAAGSASELVDSGGNALDPDLAALIDSSLPDRNKNGVWGFVDEDANGLWTSGEVMLDFDSAKNANRDQVLGYRDGYIDKRDQYAKVAGRLSLKTTRAAWVAAQGAIEPKIRGPIRPEKGKSATTFGVSDAEMPDINMAMFSAAQGGLQSAADGAAFATQIAQQLGVSVASLATYVETKPAGSTQPRYLRLDPDADLDGLPDNHATAYYEKMPFNSPNFSDWYYRPVYENMTFKDVQIPAGTNALFRNCTFVGVTYVRAHTANTHVLWGEYGKLAVVGAGRPQPALARSIYGDVAAENSYPTMLPSTARPPNQMILMASPPQDKADLSASAAAATTGFANLPDPLVIAGKRVTDTRLHSNNLRFHDSLFVGSIVGDGPTGFAQSRNKIQFTGATRFVSRHPTDPDDSGLNPEEADETEIAKSSMMLPNYSVDLGSFNSPPGQNIELKGAVIAGVLDARGNASIDGALLLTFAPVAGQTPLRDTLGNPTGNPAGFNTTIGYFGPADGDAESLDPATLPVVAGVKIVGWDTDGDGLADVSPDQPKPAGATGVPFHGYGRISLRFNPTMTLPNGIMLPMQIDPVAGSYREGKP